MPLRELTMLLAAAAWGLTFLGTKLALDSVGPLTFVAARCAIAALAVSLLCAGRLRRIGWSELRAGTLLGVVVAVALGLQSLGLASLPSGKAGFLTALYVPAVPLLLLLVGKRPTRQEWAGVLLAFIGLLALSVQGMSLQLGTGELLTIGCAIAFAVQIILTSRFARRLNPIDLSIIQLWVAAGLAAAAAALTEESPADLSGDVIWLAVVMGLVGTAFPILGMTWAQQRVPAPRATILLATEPIWAGTIAALAGEQITMPMALGCALIILGVLVSERVIGARRPKTQLAGDLADTLQRSRVEPGVVTNGAPNSVCSTQRAPHER